MEIQRSAPRAAGAVPQAEGRLEILEALRRAEGNRSKAARLLGVGRTTLYRRLQALGIEGEEEIT